MKAAPERLSTLRGGPRKAAPKKAARRRSPKPTPAPVETVMTRLTDATVAYGVPAVERIAERPRSNAFQVLIGTLLSARTQDRTTGEASDRLFAAARTPAAMAKLRVDRIERLIYPVSFYRHKARHIKAACRMLLSRFGGRVPATMDELLQLPGVGRKTANLVLIVSFGSRANICVDTHVHRIANRLGWVRTRTPEETEQALYRVIEPRWWPQLNLSLVTWGQNVCRPIGPRCGACVVEDVCPRVGVRIRTQTGLRACETMPEITTEARRHRENR